MPTPSNDPCAGISATPELTQSITKPPLKAVPITVTPVAAPPAKPTPRGGLATCTFNVKGTRETLTMVGDAAVSTTHRVLRMSHHMVCCLCSGNLHTTLLCSWHSLPYTDS